MKPEHSSDNNTESINLELGIKFGHPTYVARSEANVALGKLFALANDGNPEDALRELHLIVCSYVELLNTRHLDFAESVERWPILLPRNKKDRIAVAKKAERMSIGSVKAVTMGQPVKLEQTSNSGFALLTLNRLDTARRILRMGAYDGHEYFPGDERFCNPWIADADYMARFQETTRIGITDAALLLTIRDLPIYIPETKSVWIDVMLKAVVAFPDLVPENIAKRRCTTHWDKDGSKKKYRGGVEKAALVSGLKDVKSVPRFF